MLQKTKGIVLSFVKYRDTSIVVRIFTEQFGLRSYIVNGVRSSKSKSNKIAFFQPLTLLDLVVYNKPNRDINRISEVRLHHPYRTIGYDVRKNTIALFLAELLGKTLKEEDGNTPLFDFVADSLIFFDAQQEHIANFHLQFMVKLAARLGFELASPETLYQGAGQVHHPSPEELAFVQALLRSRYMEPVAGTGKMRSQVLEVLIKFYQFHFDNFGEMKSLPILRQLTN